MKEIGEEAYALMAELYPICRSITGEGVRKTLRLLQQRIPLVIHEVPTGTPVFDWSVPREWNIRDAYVKDARGRKVIDFHKSNLHVVNYSVPLNRKMNLAELKPHLHSIPDKPNWIPYKTTYYNDSWGFCLSHNELEKLGEGEYDVVIDSDLKDGYLTYGELVMPGQSPKEVLFSCHVCHPSMCNDNLSGIAIATFLAEHLANSSRNYTYRFVFIPGTIGAITWLAHHQEDVKQIEYGLVLTGLGDSGPLSYKKSRRGHANIDKVAAHVLRHSMLTHQILDFSPYGYDERQYCSSGFNLPVGRLSRTPFGEYPEYHTSADNLEFVKPAALGESYEELRNIINIIENNKVYKNQIPYGEPQLGKRGLYSSIGDNELLMLWVLNFSDGEHSLLDISEKSGIDFKRIEETANLLLSHHLIVGS